jgi:hypothetical protein
VRTTIQKSGGEVILTREISVETTEQTTCIQIREKLDALFEGDSRLEDAHEQIKRVLFGHLESCQSCCRSFDVRVRFRSGGRKGIY